MRWEDERRSDNVEYSSGGGGGAKKFSLVAIAVAGVIAYFTHDPAIFYSAIGQQVSNTVSSRGTSSAAYQPRTPEEVKLVDFVKVILGSTEDVWGKELPKQTGVSYVRPKLELFSGSVESGCGHAVTQTGPFYCSADQKVYLDLAFLSELKKLGASGDFAFAYVIAHEVGHHVSDLLGTLPKVNRAESQLSKVNANKLSIMLELQADCYAGVWANHAGKDYNMIENGDIAGGLQAAASVGDDKIVGDHPDLFTHGTSAQRAKWLKTGIDSGNVADCDTFKAYGIKNF